jgi:hypothetical protein
MPKNPTGAGPNDEAGGILSADDLRRMIADREAAKAAEAARQAEEAARKKKEILDSFSGPLHQSPDQLMHRAMSAFRDATGNGHAELMVYRFPNAMCTDHARAINNQEAGWEKTLTERPLAVYEFWHEHLRPHGYKLRAEVLDYQGGMPGDVGFIVSWK